jgi:hypothetical protein
MRITFPVAVILNRLAAPRCVFSFNFFTFFATNVSSLKIFPVGRALVCLVSGFAGAKSGQAEAYPAQLAGAPAGFGGGAPPPRFGAKSAIKTFASMRGPISTNA